VCFGEEIFLVFEIFVHNSKSVFFEKFDFAVVGPCFSKKWKKWKKREKNVFSQIFKFDQVLGNVFYAQIYLRNWTVVNFSTPARCHSAFFYKNFPNKFDTTTPESSVKWGVFHDERCQSNVAKEWPPVRRSRTCRQLVQRRSGWHRRRRHGVRFFIWTPSLAVDDASQRCK